MIRHVSARGKNGTLLFMGLDRRNVERLLAGEPILFDPAPLGLRLVAAEFRESGPDRVAIAAGETLQDIAREAGLPVMPSPGPGGEVRIRRDLPDDESSS